jgi:hypothetical protein
VEVTKLGEELKVTLSDKAVTLLLKVVFNDDAGVICPGPASVDVNGAVDCRVAVVMKIVPEL